MKVLGGREASMYACFADLAVDPAGGLPPVASTSAVAAFDELLAVSPPLNRAGMRAGVVAIEMAPLLLGKRRRLRRLPRAERLAVIARLERTPGAADALSAIRSVAYLTYYGDDDVQRFLGYDADAVVARAATARAEGGRW
jgi:hypothetical protein